MTQQQLLEQTLSGLEKMIAKYKRNESPGDKDRLNATKQAHTALRKVIMMIDLSGEFDVITPVKQGTKHGWMVVDKNQKTRYYC